ncbi:TonB-dependent receptor [Aureibaculum conchae]|uniref:TonB-dependent receptor n=1 Tax=Aureibaculum sp. 2308TA14-22 TaxID=3108392 RepID=UPI0033950839
MILNKKIRSFNYSIIFILLLFPSITLPINNIHYSNTLDTYDNLSPNNEKTIPINGDITEIKPFEKKLSEVTPTNSSDKQAIDIVNKTINKYESTNSTALYGRALYRQRSKNDDSFSEFAEIIYDVNFDNDGIIDWDIYEGRYAQKKETINNKNFTLLSKILRVYQPNSDILIFPLIKEFEEYYTVNILNTTNTKNGELVTISFTPLNDLKTPTVQANVVINTKSFDVIKVEGTLNNDEIKIITLGDKDAHKKNYLLNFEISYKQDDSYGLVLDYINVNHEFDYYKENTLLSHLYATSTLRFFEYYNEIPNTKKSKSKLSNLNKLGIVGYNKSFWNTNPMIKRTETDNEIIENFEKLNAFKAVFINSKEQIAIVNSGISNDPFIQKINSTISDHYKNNLTQKVFLHTDKNNYSKENKIYFSAYVTSEKEDLIFNKKDVLYVDLIKSGKIVASKVLKITNGRGYGAFTLDKSFRPGNYKVVAYTNFMKNFGFNSFFIKDIKLLNSLDSKNSSEKDKVTLKFYPEGGNIVNEINNKVAYQAQDANGNFATIQGKIIDSDGNFIATTKSKHEGLGFFYFKPKSGKSYSIVLDDGSKHEIPHGKRTGYSIMVNNINLRTMTVDIRSSVDLKSNKIYVLGLMDNKKYYQGGFTFDGKDIISFEIPKNKLPSGVMQLVLLNEAKKVIGNRSVYINNNDNINIIAEIDKNYVDNEFLKLKIKTAGHTPSASDISLAITKQRDGKPIDGNDNLISHFKLSSFLKDDRITKYINKTDRASNYKLDLMMLIGDPIDFNWLEGNSNYDVKKYQNEKGIDITGTAKDKNGNPFKGIKVKLLTKNKERIWNYEAKTDTNGMFSIKDFHEVDSTELEFRTYNTKNKQIFSKISLIEKEEFNYLDQLTFDEEYSSPNVKEGNISDFEDDFYVDGEILEGVEIKGKAERKTSRKSLYNTNPDAVIEGKDINTTNDILTSLSTVPGIRYLGGGISIRSGGSPLWTLDDMPIDGPNDVNANDIDRIEVIKSMAKTAVYGPDGVNGVIAIYTKIGVNSKYRNDIETSIFNKLGYSATEEFNYKSKNTIFWGPQISTDENGYLELLLKKTSINTKYINVNIQTINKNGELGYYNKVLKTE